MGHPSAFQAAGLALLEEQMVGSEAQVTGLALRAHRRGGPLGPPRGTRRLIELLLDHLDRV